MSKPNSRLLCIRMSLEQHEYLTRLARARKERVSPMVRDFLWDHIQHLHDGGKLFPPSEKDTSGTNGTNDAEPKGR